MDPTNIIEELPQNNKSNHETEFLTDENLRRQDITYYVMEPNNTILFETNEELELQNLLKHWNLLQIYPRLHGK